MISGCKEWDPPAIKISALADRLLDREELAYLRKSRLSWYRIHALRRARRKIFRRYVSEIVREFHDAHTPTPGRVYRSLVGIRLGLVLDACGFQLLLAKSLKNMRLASDSKPARQTRRWLVV